MKDLDDESVAESNSAARSEALDATLLEALGNGLTHAGAASLAGCSTKTVQRRVQNPRFARELASLRAVRQEELASRLSHLSSDAVSVLHQILQNGPPSLQLRAATTVMSWSVRFRDTVETEHRLTDLERQAGLLEDDDG